MNWCCAGKSPAGLTPHHQTQKGRSTFYYNPSQVGVERIENREIKFSTAITGVSSPNCGDKIEVQLLFMALGRHYQDNICSKNPVNPTTLNGSPKHDFKTVF